ncbi:MAG TPA: inverse autotransporter beta domain-containing protein, partial [Rhabdochlamydiaceae bacterium]
MNKYIVSSLMLLGCSLHAVESRIEIRNREAAGVGYNTGYTSLDYFLMTEGSVEVLLDLRGHVFNNGQAAGNAGLGFRCPIKDEKYLVGANAFYDIRQSKGLLAHQVGVGFEWLGKYVDFRTNGYLPVGTVKHLDTKEFKGFSGTSVLIKRKLKSTLPCIDAEIGTPLPKPFYFAIGGYYLFKQSESSL